MILDPDDSDRKQEAIREQQIQQQAPNQSPNK
jgi:hypothetical protein